MYANKLVLGPSYRWIPKHFAYIFYKEELEPINKAIFNLISAYPSKLAKGFLYRNDKFSIDFQDFPQSCILPEHILIKKMRGTTQFKNFVETLEEKQFEYKKYKKLIFLTNRLFIRVKREDPFIYRAFIPDKYQQELSNRTPTLNDNTQAWEVDKGYGIPFIISEQANIVDSIKEEFKDYYQMLAGEELLKQMFKEDE